MGLQSRSQLLHGCSGLGAAPLTFPALSAAAREEQGIVKAPFMEMLHFHLLQRQQSSAGHSSQCLIKCSAVVWQPSLGSWPGNDPGPGMILAQQPSLGVILAQE